MISFDRYYMSIAHAVQQRANCLGKRVGAVIVVGNRIVATGYNGVPEGMTNCLEYGCRVCHDKKKVRDKKKTTKKKERRKGNGKRYDDCICVHAEQNALMTAARFGIAVENGEVYTTTRPCFGCIKQMLQAKIRKVVYEKDWMPDRRLQREYEEIQKRFPDKVYQLKVTKTKETMSRQLSIKFQKAA
jgi:dCMP deaminase